MLFTAALVLLVAWLIGLFALPNARGPVHVLLLTGLALLLLAFLRAREEAMQRNANDRADHS